MDNRSIVFLHRYTITKIFKKMASKLSWQNLSERLLTKNNGIIPYHHKMRFSDLQPKKEF